VAPWKRGATCFLGWTPTPSAALVDAMPYDGGKSQSGVWQWIINHIPEHKTYVELFAGSGAIARLKLPAEKTVLVEKSARQAEILRATFPAAKVICGDGITLAQYLDDPDAVIYADPPYVLDARGGRRYYEQSCSPGIARRFMMRWDFLRRRPRRGAATRLR
jgi:site-specific DNA-adenine methylase